MPYTDVKINTEDGECAASLHTPEGGGSHPAVILYPDAVGYRQTFIDMAERLAGLGYAVLLPDVYYRTPFEPFDVETVFSKPEERARLGALMQGLTADKVVADAGAYLDFLAGRPEVTGSGVGTTGYCMGGRMSLLTAGHHPDRVAAAASFHGGNLASTEDPDSPYLLADRIRASVVVAAAENDASFPAEQYERLEKAFVEAGVDLDIDTYPAGHGFAVPDNGPYDEAAAERHWAALESLYGRALAAS
jgi:carboxymethylenebutenolidase